MNESKQEKQILVNRIDALVARLVRIKNGLVEEISSIPRGTWFVDDCDGKYYQYLSTNGNIVCLIREDNIVEITLQDFNDRFEQAERSDIVHHLEYLSSENIPFIITVDYPSSGSDNTIINNITDWIEGHPIIKSHDNGVKPSKSNAIFNSIKNATNLIDFGTKLHDYVEEVLKENKGVDTTKCDFYMVNVGDYTSIGNGSKIRHQSYELAETEAIRLCSATGQEAFIVGVVASVKPVKTTKTITIITPTIKKR